MWYNQGSETLDTIALFHLASALSSFGTSFKFPLVKFVN